MRFRNRRLLTAAITFGLAAATPFMVNRLSVRPGAAVIKWPFFQCFYRRDNG